MTLEEKQFFALEICTFFNASNYRKNCELIGIKKEKDKILPFNLSQFLSYLKNYKNIDGYRYQYHIGNLIHKFRENAIIYEAGRSSGGSPPFNQCYYSQLELTEKQRNNLFWLGKILGESFLNEKYKPFVVRIEGYYTNGESGTGSGIIINSNTILTCRHNLTDLVEYDCYLGESKLEKLNDKYHHTHDIGIIKLESKLSFPYFPYFGAPYELDDTLTMGYPPLRGMREAALISQKGEINAKSKDWQNCDCITISSVVRPGNSGGPVISTNGYIVGIVTQYANSASSVSVDKESFIDNNSIPFYNAISSNSIVKILEELDKSIEINYENFE